MNIQNKYEHIIPKTVWGNKDLINEPFTIYSF